MWICGNGNVIKIQDNHTDRSLLGIRVRGDGGVGVQEPQDLLEDGGPSAVLSLAGDTEDLPILLLDSPLQVVVAVITDDVTLIVRITEK